MQRLNLAIVSIILALASLPAHAGPRADHWSGFDFGVGLPFPSVYGGMIGFNVQDDARISGGIGSFGRWTTYQIDTKFFFSPDAWAGYFGAGLDYMTGNSGKFGIWDLPFNNAVVPYIQGGLDFQSDIGFHVGFNLAAAVPSGELIILPGLALGWYF